MHYPALLLLAYVAAVLQTNAELNSVLGMFAPNLLMLVLVTAAMKIRGWPAIVWAAGLGLLADCLTAERLGVQMICATLAAWLIQRALDERWGESAWSIALLCFSTIFLVTFAANLARMLLSERQVGMGEFFQATIGTSTSSALLALFTVWFWRVVKVLILRPNELRRMKTDSQWRMLIP